MLTDLKTALRPALVFALLFALLLGLAYPLTLTGIGQLLFPAQANGSLIRDGDRVIGSTLIGQAFAGQRYFHGRPSAAGRGYDASASVGSNLGPTSKGLIARVRADIVANAASPDSPVPGDLVTASASGLDPHISLKAALYQMDRVAHARAVKPDTIRALIAAHSQTRLLGILGEPRINVLALNRALDRMSAER